MMNNRMYMCLHIIYHNKYILYSHKEDICICLILIAVHTQIITYSIRSGEMEIFTFNLLPQRVHLTSRQFIII